MLQVAYSYFLKHIVLVDIAAIIAGFVLRILGGAATIHTEISFWFILCAVFLLSFIGFAKRRYELERDVDSAMHYRKVLNYHGISFLDRLIASATIICYALYAFSPETTQRYGSNVVYTLPFVLFGLARYAHVVRVQHKGGNPENMLFEDLPLLVSISLWIAAMTGIMHIPS